MKEYLSIAITIIVLSAIAISIILFVKIEPKSNDYQISLAEALTDKGAIFYGAFWCPHCARQKAIFRSAKNNLPYVECSAQDRSLFEVCKGEDIRSFPTWKFEDGIRCTGEIPLSVLAYRIGFTLPYDNDIPLTAEELFNRIEIEGAKRNPNITTRELLEEYTGLLRDLYNKELTEKYGATIETATPEQFISITEGRYCLTEEEFLTTE